MHKKVDANKTVPKAMGSSKNGKLNIFNTCIFAATIAIAVYIYKPTLPKIFKKISTKLKTTNKKINQVI